MSYTIKIKNNTEETQTWAGKEFAADEEYTIPDDANRIKWQSNSGLLAAIGTEEALVGDGSEYFADINTAINWLKGADISPKDSDGSPIQRIKVTNTGWHYQLHGIEFTTANRDSIISNNEVGDAYGFATIKLYDAEDAEITTELGEIDCVKTVVDWEPTYDYEIIGGMFKIKTTLTSDVRMWVIGVPDVPAIYGGSKLFASNVNLRYIGLEEGISVDGRSSKLLTYSAVYHTNKLRIVLTHPAGTQVDVHLIMEIFKV